MWSSRGYRPGLPQEPHSAGFFFFLSFFRGGGTVKASLTVEGVHQETPGLGVSALVKLLPFVDANLLLRPVLLLSRRYFTNPSFVAAHVPALSSLWTFDPKFKCSFLLIFCTLFNL